MEKDDKFFIILNAAIELEITKGHLQWTMSDLSRLSGITRSLIYHYFNSDKLQLVMEGVHFFGKILASTSPERQNYYAAGNFVTGILETRALIAEFPCIVAFYYFYRNKDNELGELIRRYEEEAINLRIKVFPELNRAEAETLFAIQVGLSFTPTLSDLSLENSLTAIQALLKKHTNLDTQTLQQQPSQHN